MSRLRRDEGGLSLVETLVTVCVLTVGLLATLAVFSKMGRATHLAQRQAMMTSLAQREMERLRVISYDRLGLSGPVSAEASVEAPLDGTAGRGEELVFDGVVGPGGQSFTVQGVQGKIYRYVTWRRQECPLVGDRVAADLSEQLDQPQPAVAAAIGDLCPGTRQTKRIVVVVRADAALPQGRTVQLSAVASDPRATVLSAGAALKVDATPLVGAVAGEPLSAAAAAYAAVTPVSFHLTDTPCTATTREAPVGDHPSHDTSRDGAGCSGEPAPDLMHPDAPAGSAGAPLPDLSSEVPRAAAGGLALVRDDRDGDCGSQLSYAATEAESTRRRRSVHTWATPRSIQNYETPQTGGRATLTFWTHSASARELPGRLCATVWRDLGTSLEVLGSTQYDLPAWPAEPTQLAISFDLAGAVIAAEDRLMLTLRTPQSSEADVVLLYDHPSHPSSLSMTFVEGRVLLP